VEAGDLGVTPDEGLVEHLLDDCGPGCVFCSLVTPQEQIDAIIAEWFKAAEHDS
jgi:hypothetical protein